MNAAQPRNIPAAPQSVTVIAPVYAAPHVSELVETMAARAMIKVARSEGHMRRLPPSIVANRGPEGRNETVWKAYQAIKANPGIKLSELRAVMEIGESGLLDSARKLVERGAIKRTGTRMCFRYYPLPDADLSLIRPDGNNQRLIKFVAENPGKTTGEIAVGLGLTRKYVLSKARDLVAQKRLVRKTTAIRGNVYTVAP